jgi:hypothetical protein
MKTTYSTKLARMISYLNANPDVTLPSGRVISAVELAMVRIFQNQTTDEKRDRDVKYDNNRGFQQVDSTFGSKVAERIIEGGRLYSWELPRALRMAIKYRRQLVALKDARAASRVTTRVAPQASYATA